MDVALLVARLGLALVFIVAGLAKLFDLEGSRRASAGFGVPGKIAPTVGFILPLGELAVGVALLGAASAWWGALGALALLLAFLAGTAFNLARGRSPECHCFGQLHSEPVGRGTLARNAVLAALAAFVVAHGPGNAGPGLFDGLDTLTAAEKLAAILGSLVVPLLAAQLWLLVRLVRQNEHLRARVEALEGRPAALSPGESDPGLAVAAPAPAFALPDLAGRTVHLADLLTPGKPVMLVFTDPQCSPCSALLPHIGLWQRDFADQVTIAVVSVGSIEANTPKVLAHGVTRVLLQQGREVEEAYGVKGTPGAVVIRPDGTIGSQVVAGADEIRELLRQVLSSRATALVSLQDSLAGVRGTDGKVAARGSEPVADVELIDLAGRAVRISDLRGQDTLLVFWSSSCGFCRQMVPDLQALEARPPEGAPRLVFILPFLDDSNQVVPFRSTVLIDRAGAASDVFEASATPMAVLLDADGKVASEVAAGAADVLRLATKRTLEPAAPAAGGS